MSKVLKEIILSLRIKHVNKYKYSFQNNLLEWRSVTNRNIHKSAHASCAVNLKTFTLAAAAQHRCTYADSHEQCLNSQYMFSSCS